MKLLIASSMVAILVIATYFQVPLRLYYGRSLAIKTWRFEYYFKAKLYYNIAYLHWLWALLEAVITTLLSHMGCPATI